MNLVGCILLVQVFLKLLRVRVKSDYAQKYLPVCLLNLGPLANIEVRSRTVERESCQRRDRCHVTSSEVGKGSYSLPFPSSLSLSGASSTSSLFLSSLPLTAPFDVVHNVRPRRPKRCRTRQRQNPRVLAALDRLREAGAAVGSHWCCWQHREW